MKKMEPARKIIDITKLLQGKAAKKVEGFWGDVRSMAKKTGAFAANRRFMAFGHYVKLGILESIRLVKLSKAKYDIFSTGRMLPKKYGELGRLSYKLMAEEKLSAPELNFLRNDIDGLEARLKEKKAHFDQIRTRAS